MFCNNDSYAYSTKDCLNISHELRSGDVLVSARAISDSGIAEFALDTEKDLHQFLMEHQGSRLELVVKRYGSSSTNE